MIIRRRKRPPRVLHFRNLNFEGNDFTDTRDTTRNTSQSRDFQIVILVVLMLSSILSTLVPFFKIDLASPLTQVILVSHAANMLEKLCYTMIWLNPRGFQKISPKEDPCEMTHRALMFCKCFQMGPALYLATQGYAVTHKKDFTTLMALVLCILGQVLNFAVYGAIGKNGVYYGVKFGKKIPWVNCFPYNLAWLKHPQYVGSVMSLVTGFYLLFGVEQLPLYTVGCIAIYGYIAYVEQYL